MFDEEIATLEEQIKRNTIPARFMEFNYRNNKIICPNCGKDTALTFDNYKDKDKGGEIYCEHCNTNLNAVHFVAKSKFNRHADKFSPAEYRGVIAATCRYLGIKHNLDASSELKTTSTDEAATTNNQISTRVENFNPAPSEEPATENKHNLKPPAGTNNFKPARAAEPASDDKKLLGANINEFFKNDFPLFVAENQKYQNRKTGFSNIDDAAKSFQSGIYVLGGLPALGKTTFALQLLNQLAKQGETCIFCSFEMSAGYLYSKLLAQEIFLIESGGFNEDIQHFNKDVKYPLPTSKVVFGNFQYHEDAYKQALQNFKKNPLPLYIWEIADVDLNKLLNRIKKICASLKKPPVICIDYLQLLAAGTDNTKNAVDNILRGLFNFRRETSTTFIVISSLNRANYQTEISFESFKESGSIEYSADVIWGLQLLLDKRTPAEVEKAKKEIPRQVQLKCLKNRFGANFDVGFFYYPQAEIFVPMFEYGAYTDYTPPKGESI